MNIAILEFENKLDRDNDMLIIINAYEGEISMWIDKDDAASIIEHLRRVFEIDSGIKNE